MKRFCHRGVTLVEIVVGLGIFIVIAGTITAFMQFGRKEINFSSDHLNAAILSQKVWEDLIEEMNMNPYGLETLGIDNQKNFQEVTDGKSVFFSFIRDSAPPWGIIDPAVDGTIGPGMKELYANLSKFKFAITAERRASSGNGIDRNLVDCRLDFIWNATTGRGNFTSNCLFFSPITEKNADLAYAVDETQIDARIPQKLTGDSSKTISQIATEVGENVETVKTLGRVAILTTDFVNSEYFTSQQNKIADEKNKLSSIPITDLGGQYDSRFAIAKLWYDMAKSCFQVVAYLAPEFIKLKQQGRFSTTGGFNTVALQENLQMYRIIYENFVGSLEQARYYYYSLLQKDIAAYKGGKCQLQTIQKLIDLYRILAVLPTKPQGMQEYKDFLGRLKTFSKGKNPFLARFIEQESVFLQNESEWLDRLPNLKRITKITKEQIPEILNFISQTSDAAILGNTAAGAKPPNK